MPMSAEALHADLAEAFPDAEISIDDLAGARGAQQRLAQRTSDRLEPRLPRVRVAGPRHSRRGSGDGHRAPP